MSDYLLKVTVRNNNLIKAFSDKGFECGQKLASALNVSYMTLLALVNLQRSPYDSNGEVSPSAEKIMVFTGKMFHELWCDEQTIALKTNKSEQEIDFEDISNLLENHITEDKYLENQDRERLMSNVLGTLTEREQRIIDLRYGFTGNAHTYQEIGNLEGVSNHRIAQIEAKALRKMRRHDRVKVMLGIEDAVITDLENKRI